MSLLLLFQSNDETPVTPEIKTVGHRYDFWDYYGFKPNRIRRPIGITPPKNLELQIHFNGDFANVFNDARSVGIAPIITS